MEDRMAFKWKLDGNAMCDEAESILEQVLAHVDGVKRYIWIKNKDGSKIDLKPGFKIGCVESITLDDQDKTSV